jgi:hypothetical protein
MLPLIPSCIQGVGISDENLERSGGNRWQGIFFRTQLQNEFPEAFGNEAQMGLVKQFPCMCKSNVVNPRTEYWKYVSLKS